MDFKKLAEALTARNNGRTQWRVNHGALSLHTDFNWWQRTHGKQPHLTEDWNEIGALVFHEKGYVVIKEHRSDLELLQHLGLGCYIRTGTTKKAKHEYVHRLTDVYLFKPGMAVSFKDGTPLNAPLVKDLIVNPEKRKQVLAKIQEVRAWIITTLRTKGEKKELRYQRSGAGYNDGNSAKMRKLLCQLVAASDASTYPPNTLELLFEKGFYSNSEASPKEIKDAVARLFGAYRADIFAANGVVG